MKTPVLESKRLLLRNIDKTDLKTAHNEWYSDSAVAKFMFWGTNEYEEETAEWVGFEQSMIDDPKWYRFIVCPIESKDAVYGSVLLYWEEEIDAWEIAYHFGKQHWNNGYATESVRRVLEFAKKDLKLDKVVARYALDNHASEKVLLKNGFIQTRKIDYWSCNHSKKWDGYYCEKLL